MHLFRFLVLLWLSMLDPGSSKSYRCNGACNVPFEESCPYVIANYNFSGTCCSLADNTTTGGCELTITSTTGDASCDFAPRNFSCNETTGDCSDVMYFTQDGGTSACPVSSYTVTMDHIAPPATSGGASSGSTRASNGNSVDNTFSNVGSSAFDRMSNQILQWLFVVMLSYHLK